MITATATREIDLSAADRRAARLDEYFDKWAIDPERFQQLEASCRPQISSYLNLYASQPRSESISSDRYKYQITSDGVALIVMRGPMMKFESSFGGVSTVATRRMIRSAIADDFVKAIVLVIDSPGGTVSGTKELADEVAAAAKRKPMYAHVEDYCCSAAYWVGSQVGKGRLFSSPTAMSGCIGTYMVVYDTSQAYAEAGIKTLLIKAGQYKGMGTSGVEITSEQIEHWQQGVDDLNRFFVSAVARGRKVSLAKASEWADGRAFVAARCVAMGLIDGEQTLDATIALAAAAGAKTRKSGGGAPPENVVDDEHEASSGPTPDGIGADAQTSDVSTAPAVEQTNGDGASRDQSHVTEEETDMSTKQGDAAAAASGTGAGQTAVETSGATSTPTAATLAELKAACPKASAEFLLAQLEAGATVSGAQTAFIAHLAEQNEQLRNAAVDTGSTHSPKHQKPAAGVSGGIDENPQAGGGESSGDAREAYLIAIDEQMKLHPAWNRQRAAQEVMRRKPDLVAAFNAEVNAAAHAGDRRHAAAKR